MKLLLEFELDKDQIENDYRRLFMHFFKSCIDSANHGKYYDNYYDGTRTKNFTFAVFMDKPTFEPDKILLSSNRIKLLFSTSEKMTGFIFYSSFLEKKYKKYPMAKENFMILKNVKKLDEENIISKKILVKMNSPLVIRQHQKDMNKDFYYSYQQEEFEKIAKEVINYQLEQEGFPREYRENFSIIPIKCRKVIVKHYSCKIEATLGNLLLEGNPVILNYLLQAGVGSRKSEGFGMMELLAQDV